MANQIYGTTLGCDVNAQYDGSQVKLYTSDGINEVFLEPIQLSILTKWIENIMNQARIDKAKHKDDLEWVGKPK